MTALLFRLGILLLLGILAGVIIQVGKFYIARQRKQALLAAPLETSPSFSTVWHFPRILAFGSADCTQCHTLQKPALRRLREQYSGDLEIVDIDAPSSPDLTSRYRILTLPSTVVLNAAGEPVAVNYGFANVNKLLQQLENLAPQM